MSRKILKKFDLSRVIEINLKTKKRYTPLFIPAISSAKSGPMGYRFMKSWVNENSLPNFLISAYDLKNDKENKIEIKNSFVMIDSGGYELRNIYSPTEWEFSEYIEVVKSYPGDIIASFDRPGLDLETQIDYFNQLNELENVQDSIIEFILSEFFDNELLESLDEIMEKTNVELIGIPEINLGRKFSDRLIHLERIIEIVRGYNEKTMVHILGCADPESMREYFFRGADIFDGTSWYEKYLNNFNEYQLEDISRFGECSCEACGDKNLDYYTKVFTHNLIQFDNITQNYRDFLLNGGL